jgi:signal transduction histidine kinase
MNAAPLLDTDGQPDGVVITVDDVTEQDRLQEQIQQHTAELEQHVAERTAALEASQMALLQAERLAIVGKLAASLTHEISNPMQSVIGCLGLAQEAHAEGQDTGEYLDIALTELRRVARIVARLRNLGHPPSTLTVKEPTDIHDLLDHIIDLSRKKCQEQGIEVTLRVDDPLPLPWLAPDQMEQVLLNLTINAIDAMPSGGKLSIRASLAENPGKQAGLEIVFADSGAGIPADVLPHIFDPFFSTKPENLGLGLPICQDIVQQHGGSIQVESQASGGSRFTIWLPF